MSIKINPARQEVVVGIVEFGFADVQSGAAAPAIYVPSGAIIVGGSVTVAEAFNSATSDTLDLGDETTANKYAAAVDLATAGRTDLTLDGGVLGADGLLATWTGTGAAPTAGKVRIELRYLVVGRAAFAHGPEK